MQNKKNMKIIYAYVLLVFLAAFSFRIYQFMSTGHPVGVDAYYHTRVSEQYMQGNFTNWVNYPPGIHLTTAVFSFLFGDVEFTASLLSAVFSSLLIIAVFLLAREKFGDEAAIYSAIFVALSASAVSYGSLVKNLNFAMPLLFLGIWFNTKRKRAPFLVTGLLLVIFSPLDAALLSLISILSAIMFRKNERASLITAVSLLIAALLFGYLYSGDAFARLYLDKSIPQGLASVLFNMPSVSEFFIFLSPLLIAFGIFGALQGFRKSEYTELAIIIIPIAIFFFLHVIETDRWYLYATSLLSVFAGHGICSLSVGTYRFGNYAKPMIILSLLFSGVYLSFLGLEYNSWGTLDEKRYSAYQWPRLNTAENSVVLATIYESHWILGISYRDPVCNANLIEESDFSGCYEDISKMYTTKNSTLRQNLLDEYNVSYILISDKTYWQFDDIRGNFHSHDFELVYRDEPYEIYSYAGRQ